MCSYNELPWLQNDVRFSPYDTSRDLDKSDNPGSIYKSGGATAEIAPIDNICMDPVSFNTGHAAVPNITHSNYESVHGMGGYGAQFGNFAFSTPYNQYDAVGPVYLDDSEVSKSQQMPQVDEHSPSQNGTFLSQKRGQRVCCTNEGCSMTFASNSEMQRHILKIHENGGCICGLCLDNGSNGSVIRKDHFVEHLRNNHVENLPDKQSVNGLSGLLRKCEICQPTNKKQSVLFPTQDILASHMRKKHEASGIVISNQGPLVKELRRSSDGLVNSKQMCEIDQGQGMKRIRSPSTAVLHSDSNKRSCLSTGSISTDIIPLQDSLVSHERSQRGILNDDTCYIPNVGPCDFIEARPVTALENLANVVGDNTITPGVPLISFDVSRSCIIVHAAKELLQAISDGVEQALKSTHRPDDSMFKDIIKRFRSGVLKQPFLDFGLPKVTANEARGSIDVFAIRKKQDSHVIELWMMKVVPSLSKILDETIGRNYTASLVRQGTTTQSARPTIRIQSPQVPLDSTRQSIRKRLNEECNSSLQELGIQVQFLKQPFVLIAGEDDNEVDDSPRPLPYYTRYWRYAGMGASIGMICTDDEFATFGCYVDIDGQIFILSVDHFIAKSYGRADINRDVDRKSLTSPALAKVNKMNGELRGLKLNLASELKAKLEELGPTVSAKLSKDQSRPLEEILAQIRLVETFLKELNKSESDFKIGSLSHRCKKDAIVMSSSTSSALAFSDTGNLGHRVDWALFEVDRSADRVGSNRHRYKHFSDDSDDSVMDFLPIEQNVVDEGEGEICQETSVVEGNEEAYFVGQTSGLIEGEVNGALKLVCFNGIKTNEHHIIPKPEYRRSEKKYAGDSGAMLLRKKDNKMIGLIWGCDTNLTFTPIRSVFEDIKSTINAESVDLPRTPDGNSAVLISGSQREAPKERAFRSSDVPVLASLTPDINKDLENIKKDLEIYISLFTANDSKESNLQDVSPEPLSVESRRLTPVPGLSSSRTSSPQTVPTTPTPSGVSMAAAPPSPVCPVLIVGEDVAEDTATFPSADEAGDNELDNGQLKKLPAGGSIIKSKASIPYILRDVPYKPMGHIIAPTPMRGNQIRRFCTWPLDLKPPRKFDRERPQPVPVSCEAF
ncbi:hypothetical protein F5884DRAFT_888726 [Xylogone sp. PMI_703]|nr:hypothetical protein F5884DRAFT_888726 [Xylogone sp. PMI_703]